MQVVRDIDTNGPKSSKRKGNPLKAFTWPARAVRFVFAFGALNREKKKRMKRARALFCGHDGDEYGVCVAPTTLDPK